MKLTRYKNKESCRDLWWSVLGLLLGAIFLESSGLQTWAERLEISHFRNYALNVTSQIAWVVKQSHVENLRPYLLSRVNSMTFEPTNEVGVTQNSAVQEASNEAAQYTSPVENSSPQKAVDVADSRNANLNVPVVKPPAIIGRDGANVTVELLGDSMMAVGLAPYLIQHLKQDFKINVVRAYRSGTGLARPEVFDWTEQYPKIVGNAQADIIVCAIGANDAQSFLINNKPVQFGSEAWSAEYLKRVDELLDLAAPNHRPVLWLALPSMRSAKFSKHASQLNAIVKAKLEEREGVIWMDANTFLSGDEKSYVEYVQEGDKLVRLRLDDGIHYSNAGAERVGAGVIKWLSDYLGREAAVNLGNNHSGQGSSTSAGL